MYIWWIFDSFISTIFLSFCCASSDPSLYYQYCLIQLPEESIKGEPEKPEEPEGPEGPEGPEKPPRPGKEVVALPKRRKSVVNLASKRTASVGKPKDSTSKLAKSKFTFPSTKSEEDDQTAADIDVEVDQSIVEDTITNVPKLALRVSVKKEPKVAKTVIATDRKTSSRMSPFTATSTPSTRLSGGSIAISESPPESPPEPPPEPPTEPPTEPPPEPEIALVTVTQAPQVEKEVIAEDRKTPSPAPSVKVSVDSIAALEPPPEPEVALPTKHVKPDMSVPSSKPGSLKSELKSESDRPVGSKKSGDSSSSARSLVRTFPDETDLAGNILEAMFNRDIVRESRLDYFDSDDASDQEKESRKKEIRKDSMSEKMYQESSKKRTDMQKSIVRESLYKSFPASLTTEANQDIVVNRQVTKKFVTKVRLPKYLTEDTREVSGADKKTISGYTEDSVAKPKDLAETKDVTPGKLGKRGFSVSRPDPLSAEKQLDSKTQKDSLLLDTKTSDFQRKKSTKEYLTGTETEVDETDRSIPDFVPKRKVKTEQEIWVEDVLKRGAISKLKGRKKTSEQLAETTPHEVKYKEEKNKISEELTSEKNVRQKRDKKESGKKQLQERRLVAKQKPGRKDFEKTLTAIKRKSEAKQENWLEQLIIKDNLTETSRKKSVQPARDTDDQLMASQEPSTTSTDEWSESSTTSTSEEQDGIFKEPSLKYDGTRSTAIERSTDKKLDKMKDQFFKTRQRIRNAQKKAMERAKRAASIDLPIVTGVRDEELQGKLAALRKTSRIVGHDAVAAKHLNVDPKTLVINYMATKQIYQIFQFFMNQLLVDFPDEPLDYLIELVRSVDVKQTMSRHKSTIFVN